MHDARMARMASKQTLRAALAGALLCCDGTMGPVSQSALRGLVAFALA